MGFLGLLKGACGFGMGASAGAMIGYFFFIFFQPNDVKVCKLCTILSKFWLLFKIQLSGCLLCLFELLTFQIP